MGSLLRITRTPYEEPHQVCLLVQASNGHQTSEIEIYSTPDDLQACARALSGFPRHAGEVFLWELGSERPEDNWAFYFRFRVFATSVTGGCAIQFRFNNNQELPDTEVSEFCIRAEPAQLDRLGSLFGRFALLGHEVLLWQASGGGLFEKAPGVPGRDTEPVRGHELLRTSS